MAFSFDRFYRLNRRVVLWIAVLGVLWLLRDFFALIFLTFVLSFLSSSLLERRWLERLGFRARLVAVYLLFLVVLAAFVSLVVPNAVRETARFVTGLDQVKERLVTIKSEFVAEYPALARPLRGYLRAAIAEESLARVEEVLEREARTLGFEGRGGVREVEGEQLEEERAQALQRYHEREDKVLVEALFAQIGETLRKYLPQAINLVYRASATLLLALLLSFLILADRRRLATQLHGLRSSRLQDLYEEAATPLVRFGYIVGRALEAQATIALANTVLTTGGLLALGVPSVTMLAVVVFVCSFVPVLGVFLSTTPIVLVALNAGGIVLGLSVVGLVVIIHALEAYVLNPLIYGQHLKLNPVLVLIVLLVGYHLFGVWGMVLGLPVTLYLLTDVLGVTLWQQETRATPAAALPEEA